MSSEWTAGYSSQDSLTSVRGTALEGQHVAFSDLGPQVAFQDCGASSHKPPESVVVPAGKMPSRPSNLRYSRCTSKLRRAESSSAVPRYRAVEDCSVLPTYRAVDSSGLLRYRAADQSSVHSSNQFCRHYQFYSVTEEVRGSTNVSNPSQTCGSSTVSPAVLAPFTNLLMRSTASASLPSINMLNLSSNSLAFPSRNWCDSHEDVSLRSTRAMGSRTGSTEGSSEQTHNSPLRSLSSSRSRLELLNQVKEYFQSVRSSVESVRSSVDSLLEDGLQKQSRDAKDAEYPAYGVTGPSRDLSPGSGGTGDRNLAHSAHMYHYQQQKNQMIAIDRSGEGGAGGGASDGDSEEDDGDERDYTVYECPGLAPMGELVVPNPMYPPEDATPASPTMREE